jgi:hypothetical protein
LAAGRSSCTWMGHHKIRTEHENALTMR